MKALTNQKGFSLVELMVVVAIIGILSAIALPKFRVFQVKARQAEAKTNLASIFSLEQSYQAENDTFVPMPAGQECAASNLLGFYISGCTAANAYQQAGSSGPRYQYSVVAGGTGIRSSFTATARSGTNANNRVAPGCATADVWTINQDRVLAATSNNVTNC